MIVARCCLPAVALVSAVIVAPAMAAESFVVDKVHSNVVFMVDHLGYAKMIGRFDDFSGDFTFDDKDHTVAKLAVTIQAASINTHHKARDDHLRSPDFFNAREYPTLTFVSTKVERTGDKTGKVTGDFTMLGVTKPATLDVTFNKMAPHPLPQYKAILTAGFSARGKIKRSDFGMKYALPNLGDDIEVIVEVEAMKKG